MCTGMASDNLRFRCVSPFLEDGSLELLFCRVAALMRASLIGDRSRRRHAQIERHADNTGCTNREVHMSNSSMDR
jgi:hypothetical protein